MVSMLYPIELQLNKATSFDTEDLFLDFPLLYFSCLPDVL